MQVASIWAPTPCKHFALVALTSLVLVFSGDLGAQIAQSVQQDDGRWRYAFGVGSTYSTGNNDNSSLTLSADAIRSTLFEKLEFYGKTQVTRADGKTTGEVGRLGARYQREINSRGVYGFGQTEAFRDTAAKLASRYSFGNGGGIHLVRTEDDRFDVFAGIGYAQDRYTEPNNVGGAVRLRYSRFEALLGQESSHRFTSNTTFKQRLVIYPNLTTQGEYRAEFDVGLSVAMNKSLSLTTNLALRYNSDPGRDLDRQDVSLITALSWKTR